MADGSVLLTRNVLCLNRCTDRTYARARAALNAGLRIDHIFSVTSRNRRYGALRLARTTADAFISNFISHKIKHLLWNFTPIVS